VAVSVPGVPGSGIQTSLGFWVSQSAWVVQLFEPTLHIPFPVEWQYSQDPENTISEFGLGGPSPLLGFGVTEDGSYVGMM
jgi:hypothetical protein